MTRSQARDYISEHPEIILERDRDGRGFICPICSSGAGKNGTGLFVQRGGKHFSCFGKGTAQDGSKYNGCFKNKDIFDIIGLKFGLTDFKDKLEAAADFAGIELMTDAPGTWQRKANAIKAAPGHQENAFSGREAAENSKNKPTTEPDRSTEPPKDYTKAYNYWHGCIDKTDYWKQRGFTREIMSRFKVGYNPEFTIYKDGKPADTWKALIIPVTKYSFAVRNTDPNAAHSDRHRKVGAGKNFYNPLKIDFTKLDRPVFIVEGELDALSIIQAGGAAIAARSTDNIPALIDWLKDRQPPEPRAIFGFMDNDEAGRTGTAELEQGLKDTFFLFEGFFPPRGQDANDILRTNPQELERFIEHRNSNYQNDTEALRNAR